MELLVGDDDAVCLLCQLYHESAGRGHAANHPDTRPCQAFAANELAVSRGGVLTKSAALGGRGAGAQEPIPSSMQPSGSPLAPGRAKLDAHPQLHIQTWTPV